MLQKNFWLVSFRTAPSNAKVRSTASISPFQMQFRAQSTFERACLEESGLVVILGQRVSVVGRQRPSSSRARVRMRFRTLRRVSSPHGGYTSQTILPDMIHARGRCYTRVIDLRVKLASQCAGVVIVTYPLGAHNASTTSCRHFPSLSSLLLCIHFLCLLQALLHFGLCVVVPSLVFTSSRVDREIDLLPVAFSVSHFHLWHLAC